MRKKENKTSKGKGIGFLGFLVFAFVLVIAGNVILSQGLRLETIIVRSGSEENVIKAKGYIFRDQTVVYAPTDGYLYCEAAEDERVSRGETVMSIYKNQVNLSASNELKQVEEKISELSEGIRSADVFSSDPAKLEQTISQNLKGVPKAGARNNMERILDICDEVNLLIEKRRKISGEIEAVSPAKELEELKRKKAQLEEKYNIERTLIHAPKTGAFTSRIDGAEEKLSRKALENINSDYIKELDKLNIKIKTQEQISKGQPAGKIVDNFLWSIAAEIPKAEAEGLKSGDSMGIRLPDIGAQVIEGTISKITPEESGKVILVVNSNKYISAIYSMSRVTVEFVKNSYGGFRIPAKSLRMTDGVMGVYIVRNDKARFVPVELLYSGKDWVVVSEKGKDGLSQGTLKLYDELIVSGKDIYEGKVVR